MFQLFSEEETQQDGLNYIAVKVAAYLLHNESTDFGCSFH